MNTISKYQQPVRFQDSQFNRNAVESMNSNVMAWMHVTQPAGHTITGPYPTFGAYYYPTRPRRTFTMDRIKQLASQFVPSTARSRLEAKSPEDVVITMAIRSPMCKVSKH